MLPFLLSAALFNSPIIAAGGVCSGADPAIVGASLKSATPNGDLTHYVVDVTVTNRGGAGQPSNLLQSVDVTKTRRRSIRRACSRSSRGRRPSWNTASIARIKPRIARRGCASNCTSSRPVDSTATPATIRPA